MLSVRISVMAVIARKEGIHPIQGLIAKKLDIAQMKLPNRIKNTPFHFIFLEVMICNYSGHQVSYGLAKGEETN